MRSSMVNDWLQTPPLRALRNKLSRRPLSAFDNCPANDGRAYVTTGKYNGNYNDSSADDVVGALQRHFLVLEFLEDFALFVRLDVAKVTYVPVSANT